LHDSFCGFVILQQSDNPVLHVSVPMFRQAAHDFDFGVPANSLVGDDRILQCALSQLLKQQRQQDRQHGSHDQQLAAQVLNGVRAQSAVLLLSNDKVMQLKVGP
jgi:hypothetical protein